MNDYENHLLISSKPSASDRSEQVPDNNRKTTATMVDNPPAERANDAPDNFGSLTYVSSKGFFFQ
ncbi:MAG: hypothetical protein WBM39_02240 [Parasphingorhabdus sp.]